jgi:hypothetical protein
MLFMVVENFKDKALIGERFARQGRMFPDGVTYQASWVDTAGIRCFQVMEAPSREALQGWISRWADIVDFEVIPVLTSSDFWSKAKQS